MGGVHEHPKNHNCFLHAGEFLGPICTGTSNNLITDKEFDS